MVILVREMAPDGWQMGASLTAVRCIGDRHWPLAACPSVSLVAIPGGEGGGAEALVLINGYRRVAALRQFLT